MLIHRESLALPAWILSGSTLRPSLFRFSRRWRSSIYSLMWADYLRACTRERNPRDDHLILLWDYHRYVLSMHGMQTCARFLSALPFVRLLFIASSRESSRSVASFALRRSPSCKTRFAGYTTVARLSRREKRERAKKKGKKKRN